MIVDDDEDEDEDEEEKEDNLVNTKPKKKMLIEHIPHQAVYTSDSEIRSKKKKPSMVQKVDYSLSSEEGPLNIAAKVSSNYMYDEAYFKFQIEEEKKGSSFSPTI